MLDSTRQDTEAEERGCLRLVLGVPLVILNLVAGWFCWTAVAIRPAGPWDDDARLGIRLSCLLTIVAVGLALVITLTPSARQALNRWWTAPPLMLGLVAVVRWVLTE